MDTGGYVSAYTLHDNKVDAIVDPKTRNHWKRYRKAEVDLLHGAPFVLDRQLEDQRFQLEFNKNPRAYENTKVEKTRSQKLIQKAGNAAPIATKVKALNKIVREASGVYNYTLVPPPRRKDDPPIPEVYDADTHPLTKPYRDASKLNPSVCSFGHRPSSASRTFHPATMNFRLKKGEIVKPGANGKTGFGLTPANLAKVINAPRYVSLEESLELDQTKTAGSTFGSAHDPFGLFTAPVNDPDMMSADVDENRLSSQTPEGRSSRHLSASVSVGTQSQGTERKLKKLASEASLGAKHSKARALSPLPLDRPTWDDWHHRIDLEKRLREKFKLRGSALDRAEITLSERLNRYAKLTTVDVKEPKMYCKEKWDLDTALHNGTITVSQLGGRGMSNYLYDPDVESEFIRVKKLRKKYEKELQKKHEYMDFVNELDNLPDVPYQPSVLVASIDLALNESALRYSNSGDVSEMPTQATLSATQSCAAVESVAKQNIKAPELVIDRGPFLDLTKPKSPWGRGPNDNYSVPRPKDQALLLPSEKLAQFLPANSNVPVAKDFVFSKIKGSKKTGDFPLNDTKPDAPVSTKKHTKKAKSKKSEEEDFDLLHADTTPALSAEMDAVAANLLSGEVVIDNTRKAPVSMPVIYCGSDWESYYKDKKKVSTHNKEMEITKASVPSVAEYIESLRNRTDFEFDNKHTYKRKVDDGFENTDEELVKKSADSKQKTGIRGHENISHAAESKSTHLTNPKQDTKSVHAKEEQIEQDDKLSPPGTANSTSFTNEPDGLDSSQPELDRQQFIGNEQPDDAYDDAEQPTDEDYADYHDDEDRGSSASPTRHRDDDEEKYDATIRYGD